MHLCIKVNGCQSWICVEQTQMATQLLKEPHPFLKLPQLRLTCSTLSVGRVKAEASLRDVSSGSMSGMGILKDEERLRRNVPPDPMDYRSLKVLVFAPGLSWPKRFIQKRVQNQSEVEQTQMVTPSAQGAFRVSCSCRCRCRRRRCSPAALSGGPVRAEARDVSRWQHALGILKGLQLVL
eukprot:s416_g47.t3